MNPYHRPTDEHEQYRQREWNREHKAGGFRCTHCQAFVVINQTMGTVNRNHCTHCLWSKHVDETKGDRRAACKGGMQPIGLTLKHEGQGRTGELMLVHRCTSCGKISINRIARDDPEAAIAAIFEAGIRLAANDLAALQASGIDILGETDRSSVLTQLYGNV